MLRLANFDNKISEADNLILEDQLDHSSLIPISFGGRLVNELGKQLLKACSDGDTCEIRRLLTEGAPFTADWLGTSPLHLAAQCNHLEVCEILLRAGISTNCRTKVDRTPLHLAAYEGHIDIANLLMRQEAEIDCTDLLGMTPLHWAVQKGHSRVVQALLQFGADKEVENKFCLKPLDIAQQINRLDIVEILEAQLQEDPAFATENLTNEMAAEDENLGVKQVPINNESCADEAEVSQCSLDNDSQMYCSSSGEIQPNSSLSDSMKILQDHGITLLPNDDDDNNILSTVIESGHSVVLTDIGKQILNSVNLEESNNDIVANMNKKSFIRITADQLMALANTSSANKNQNVLVKQIVKDSKTTPRHIKRIVMKKNKLQPINPIPSQKNKNFQARLSQSPATEIDIELIKKKLELAKKSIEQYKLILLEKEAEVEKYQLQLKLLGYS